MCDLALTVTDDGETLEQFSSLGRTFNVGRYYVSAGSIETLAKANCRRGCRCLKEAIKLTLTGRDVAPAGMTEVSAASAVSPTFIDDAVRITSIPRRLV